MISLSQIAVFCNNLIIIIENKIKKITHIKPVVLFLGVDKGQEVYKGSGDRTVDELNGLLEDLKLQLDTKQYSSIKVTYED